MLLPVVQTSLIMNVAKVLSSSGQLIIVQLLVQSRDRVLLINNTRLGLTLQKLHSTWNSPLPPPPPRVSPLRGIDHNCAGLAYLQVLEAYRPIFRSLEIASTTIMNRSHKVICHVFGDDEEFRGTCNVGCHGCSYV